MDLGLQLFNSKIRFPLNPEEIAIYNDMIQIANQDQNQTVAIWAVMITACVCFVVAAFFLIHKSLKI